MHSFFTIRGLLVLAAPFMLAGLASCSHTPEAATATTTPEAAAAPTTMAPTAAPTAAPTPVAAEAEAPKAAPAKVLPKPTPAKTLPATQPAPATPVAAEAAPAPAPEPVAAPAPAAPATHTQAGRVLDESGRPLVGATVMLRGSTKGTSTDANGSYTLEVPNGENTFLVGYGGYEDETATSRDGQPLNVTLLPSPTSKGKKRR